MDGDKERHIGQTENTDNEFVQIIKNFQELPENGVDVGTQQSFAVLFYTAPKSPILLDSDKCYCFCIIFLDSCMSILFILTVIITK